MASLGNFHGRQTQMSAGTKNPFIFLKQNSEQLSIFRHTY